MIRKTLEVGFSWTKNANSPKLKGSQVANGGVEDDAKNATIIGDLFRGEKELLVSGSVFLL